MKYSARWLAEHKVPPKAWKIVAWMEQQDGVVRVDYEKLAEDLGYNNAWATKRYLSILAKSGAVTHMGNRYYTAKEA